MLMADAVDKAASVTPGKESHAMESFAYALRQLPAIIAENGGYDAAQLVSELKALHAQGNSTKGLGEYTLRRLVIRKVLSTRIWGVPPACLGSR